MALQVAEQMADYLMTGAVTNALNMPSVSAEDAPRLRPYLKLAEQLGSFAGQITETSLESVTVEYEGEIADLNTKPDHQRHPDGPAAPAARHRSNSVSAPVLARERAHRRQRDPQRQGKRLPPADPPDGQEPTAAPRVLEGSLFGGDKPRIVTSRGRAAEAELSEHMLFIRNEGQAGLQSARSAPRSARPGSTSPTSTLGRTRSGRQCGGPDRRSTSCRTAPSCARSRTCRHVVTVKAMRF